MESAKQPAARSKCEVQLTMGKDNTKCTLLRKRFRTGITRVRTWRKLGGRYKKFLQQRVSNL